jgi:hypothetical protein
MLHCKRISCGLNVIKYEQIMYNSLTVIITNIIKGDARQNMTFSELKEESFV